MSDSPSNSFANDSQWHLVLEGGLVANATEHPDSPILLSFFEGYDRAFVLPNEREELDGFRRCLEINEAMRTRFGRIHKELVMTLEDESTGEILGGANFLATRIDNSPENHPSIAVALNYLFVDSTVRGRGLSRRLLEAVATLAGRAVGDPGHTHRPAIFIEQNDPLQLSDEEYAADSAHAGIDQIDRLAIWARLGARLVDFPYIQPPLSETQESDDNLTYAVLGFQPDQMDAGYFRNHLESFFGISVFKGKDPA
ncbi:MAG: GNAT family N-acetyltransferase, partial [Verrucomicrobiaceae bacterium]